MSDDAFRRIDALIQVGLRIAASARSGRVVLARIADAIALEWIPRPWGEQIVAELEAARAKAVQRIDAKRIERILTDAWGAGELDGLDPEPVAVTPTSQVHRGVLEGRPVAVKVLRPGLAATVRQDLALLEGLLVPLGAAFPALDAGAMLHEFRERVVEELDLEVEATVQRRFHRALRHHPFLTVPAPVMRLASESVLVSEWVDGIPLYDAPDRDQAAHRLLEFVLGAAKSGIVHADPHPDDVLVLDDGRLAILDFGATREVDPARLDHARSALEAFAAGDIETFGRAIEALGWLPSSAAAAAIAVARHALGELAGPGEALLDGEAVIAARDRLLECRDELGGLLSAGALQPEDLWPARSVAQLFATIARVGARGDWVKLARRALSETPS